MQPFAIFVQIKKSACDLESPFLDAHSWYLDRNGQILHLALEGGDGLQNLQKISKFLTILYWSCRISLQIVSFWPKVLSLLQQRHKIYGKYESYSRPYRRFLIVTLRSRPRGYRSSPVGYVDCLRILSPPSKAVNTYALNLPFTAFDKCELFSAWRPHLSFNLINSTHARTQPARNFIARRGVCVCAQHKQPRWQGLYYYWIGCSSSVIVVLLSTRYCSIISLLLVVAGLFRFSSLPAVDNDQRCVVHHAVRVYKRPTIVNIVVIVVDLSSSLLPLPRKFIIIINFFYVQNWSKHKLSLLHCRALSSFPYGSFAPSKAFASPPLILASS